MQPLRKMLVYKTNRILEILKKIASEKRPVGLIGNGVYAKILCDALPKYSIFPEFIVLDEKYIKGSRIGANGLPLITPDECNSRYPDANLIIAYNYKNANKNVVIRDESMKFVPGADIICLGAVFLNELDWLPFEFVLGNIAAFEETYNMLNDNLSRRIMAEYINAKISGDASKLLVFNTDSKNDYDLKLMLGNIKSGAIIDCGAYDGNTALQIDSWLNGSHKIYAMEPASENYDLLCRNAEGHPSIIPIKKGTGDKEYFAFITGESGTAAVSENAEGKNEKIEITKIDKFIGEKIVSAIFMDVEGSELSALKGAENVIRRDHPLLAVRVYHKCEDLITIPQYIASLSDNDEYSYYIRINNSCTGTYDLTLYAV